MADTAKAFNAQFGGVDSCDEGSDESGDEVARVRARWRVQIP